MPQNAAMLMRNTAAFGLVEKNAASETMVPIASRTNVKPCRATRALPVRFKSQSEINPPRKPPKAPTSGGQDDNPPASDWLSPCDSSRTRANQVKKITIGPARKNCWTARIIICGSVINRSQGVVEFVTSCGNSGGNACQSSSPSFLDGCEGVCG